MTEYTIAHPDASATREHMEQVVAAHGGIKAIDYKVARLVVEAEDDVMEAFMAAHPSWIVNPMVYLEIDKPRIDLEAVRRVLEQQRNGTPKP